MSDAADVKSVRPFEQRKRETKRRRRVERKVMDRLGEEWGYNAETLPDGYGADWMLATGDGELRAFVAIETRKPVNRSNVVGIPFHDDVMFPLDKWADGMWYADVGGQPFIILCCIRDGNGVWYYRAKSGDPQRFDAYLGTRVDEHGNENTEPHIFIPFDEFDRVL